jgi:hypothetical protein
MDLHAKTVDDLAQALKRLPANTRGRLSFDDYESITAEEFDEFSAAGRSDIGRAAAEAGCRLDPPHDTGVFFVKI